MDQATALLPRQALEYDGRIGQLYRIFVVNLLLTIITIGIYRFWAITRWRRYFWSHMTFQEDRFEYTGRGGELFLGALMALGILIGLSIVASSSPMSSGRSIRYSVSCRCWRSIWPSSFSAPARFSAQRYRLSRTLWCGIRGGMQGSALAYGLRLPLYAVVAVDAVPVVALDADPPRGAKDQREPTGQRGVQLQRPCARSVSAIPGDVPCHDFAVRGDRRRGLDGYRTRNHAVLGRNSSDPRLAIAIQRAVPVVIIGVIAFGIGAGMIGCWYFGIVRAPHRRQHKT